MILGAISISMAEPAASEKEHWDAAMHRECDRYGLNTENVTAVVAGDDPLADHKHRRRWWEVVIMLVATGIFVWLAVGTRTQHIEVSLPWMITLIVGTMIPLGLVGTLLWRRTRFS
jgi:hypothetical protein